MHKGLQTRPSISSMADDVKASIRDVEAGV